MRRTLHGFPPRATADRVGWPQAVGRPTEFVDALVGSPDPHAPIEAVQWASRTLTRVRDAYVAAMTPDLLDAIDEFIEELSRAETALTGPRAADVRFVTEQLHVLGQGLSRLDVALQRFEPR